jgi:hypothetical protein
MEASRRDAWVRSALLIGLAYGLIGRLFALPANDVHAWRLAAWIVSGAMYAAHIGYEHFRLRNSPRSTALHVAVAVAIGTIALIVAGMLHDLSTASTIRAAWLLAIVVLPVVTAVPAFLGGLVAGAILRHFSAERSRDK